MKRSIKITLGLIIGIVIIAGIALAANRYTQQAPDEEIEVKEIPESALNSRFGYMGPSHLDWQDLEEYQEERYNYLSWERDNPGFANWNIIEPTKGNYDWEDIDEFVKITQENEIQILFPIWPFTEWDQETCNSDLRWDPTPVGKDPRDYIHLTHRSGMICDIDAYKKFLRMLIERYDGDGLEDMPGLRYPIRYWEIANEPGLYYQCSAEEYFEILKVSYKTIKKVDPDAKVLIAAMPTLDSTHLNLSGFESEKVFELGAAKYFDIMNTHGFGRAEQRKDFLESHGAGDKPIWVTEPAGLSKFKEPVGEKEEEKLKLELIKLFEKEFDNNVERVFVGGSRFLDFAMQEAITFLEQKSEEEESGSSPEHCYNQIYDQGEQGLDCGWTCPNKCGFVEKKGVLAQDETWEGNIYVNGYLTVPEGVTLTILPGTIVKFKYGNKDYKNLDKGGALGVSGGTLKAIGTPEQQIWFTSAAPGPINGDWRGIGLHNSSDSELKYVIVEFAELGISQMDSEVEVSNSIIRWTNSEGLYAERSSPAFRNNLLYSNAYHEIALEQDNHDVVIENNIFRDGWVALLFQETQASVSGNYFNNYKGFAITASGMSSVEVTGNKFEKITSDFVVHVADDLVTSTIENNDFGDGSISIPELDFEDNVNFGLGYLPGDPKDKFPYTYDEEDETRKVVKKLGEGLDFGWTVTYANDYIYRFKLAFGEKGEYNDFIRIDPETDKQAKYGNDWIINPRGLTWDGEYFYVNDFSQHKIFKFAVDGDFINIIDSFDIPYPELGGVNGLTNDGEFLYLRSRDGEKIYKLTKQGELDDELSIPGGSLVWNGEYFWTTCGNKGLCKYTLDGTLVGEIYNVAAGTWGMDWLPADNDDGGYLLTTQRTCESWDKDPKVYQIEILDDSLSEPKSE
jgi:hypothetical protein